MARNTCRRAGLRDTGLRPRHSPRRDPRKRRSYANGTRCLVIDGLPDLQGKILRKRWRGRSARRWSLEPQGNASGVLRGHCFALRFGGARTQRQTSGRHDCHWGWNSEERFNPNDRRNGFACKLERPVATKKTKDIGTSWAKSGATAVLSVPSVVVQNERNDLLNPAHHFSASSPMIPFGNRRRLRSSSGICAAHTLAVSIFSTVSCNRWSKTNVLSRCFACGAITSKLAGHRWRVAPVC